MTLTYKSEAHDLVCECGDPGGSDWPEGFSETLTKQSVSIDQDYEQPLVRWEFKDGSSIVEINGFWDYGIHRDRLEEAEKLVDPDDEENDPLYIWPENHSRIPPEWQVS